MFKKLFKKVDEIIEKFNEITNLENLAIEVLHILDNITDNIISEDKDIKEKTFDEIMQKPGLWKSIGIKLKKSLKDKEEFLKQLLYICTLMNEFDRRSRILQKTKKRDKELNKIIEKYTKYIKEISENQNLTQEQKNTEIKKMRKQMEKEIKELDLEHER